MKLLQLLITSTLFIIAGFSAVSFGSPWQFITGSDPLTAGAVTCGAVIAASFSLAWLTGDYSQTDRLWSMIPILYTWFFAARAWPDARLIVMASLVTIWGARLTFNFARKGGYTSEEDYRWAVLRKRINNPIVWQLFNLLFIAGYQHLLVFLFTLPAYAAYINRGVPLGAVDYVAAVIFIILVLFETIADQQMWNFQQEKYRRIAAGEAQEGDYRRGFITSGLFRYSRHPNYFAEVSIWWVFYLYAPAASGEWLHWTIIGAVLLTLLFQGSVRFTESITAEKYPEYGEYRRRVSALIPWFARSRD